MVGTIWKGQILNKKMLNITREGFLRKNIVAVLRSRTFSLKIKKLLYFFKSLKSEACVYTVR